MIKHEFGYQAEYHQLPVTGWHICFTFDPNVLQAFAFDYARVRFTRKPALFLCNLNSVLLVSLIEWTVVLLCQVIWQQTPLSADTVHTVHTSGFFFFYIPVCMCCMCVCCIHCYWSLTAGGMCTYIHIPSVNIITRSFAGFVVNYHPLLCHQRVLIISCLLLWMEPVTVKTATDNFNT